ncbi:hypothetical protein A5750_20335 [Mycobacterium sp. 852002-51613_SCH5001154]|uniref:hypothetical protein n=1 Tax=Mycobacterium sp. 852002-51613_SCH5001154 TaxID=1834104 RepID=UPI0007FFD979|nr:hypothetical protein [Mycobacterium sp. 852002-51613_SCH5001154]OBF71510.1 hypothetical protein A5750_20335 [Mycobacterium sp. 852002-51613_SCH5001154]
MSPPDAARVEELIDIAAEQESQEATQQLFSALKGVEIFFARTTVRHEGKELNATPLLLLPDGKHAMMLYTSRDHPDLPDKFAGGVFEDALAAAREMPDLDWVILSNLASNWVAMNKQQISAALRGERPVMVTTHNSSEPSQASGDLLEDLITRTVRTPQEQILPSIASALRGREVFVELAKARSEDGQPIMKTFAIEHLPTVLRAYTTRSRPAIRYGGMQWEALREMVKAAAQLSGIQIVNEADDWVVFDRAALGLEAGD